MPAGVARGEEGAVSRAAMRAAVNDAKQALSAARASGMNPSECERLLSEAVSASYRMDYARARRFARRAESVALSMLERAAAENGGGRRDGADRARPDENRAPSEEE